VAKVYAAMRPFIPGASYVNYCDLDLPDYASAYWGDNLPRLTAVKQQYHPGNFSTTPRACRCHRRRERTRAYPDCAVLPPSITNCPPVV
jgi:hypothetical protein